MSIKIGICGLGKMGTNHMNVWKKFPDVELSGLYDINAQYMSKDDFLEAAKSMDGVSICSPNDTHVEIALEILNVNPDIKILIEKPISDVFVKAYELQSFSKNILAGYVERFNPLVAKLKSMHTNGEFGKIFSVHTSRVSSYKPTEHNRNVAKDLLIHDIDVVSYLLSGDITKIAKTYMGYRDVINRAYYHGAVDKTIFLSEASWLYPLPHRKITLQTENGIFYGDYFSKTLIHNGSDIPIEPRESLYEEQSHLIDMIINDIDPICSVSDAIKSLEIVS